jgi:type II secretory pathway predicted ATPase ExeA
MTPLIGRTAELDMLRQRWAHCSDSEMRCVLLTGEPGIGKSRMLRAFRDSISADAHEVVSFHCSSYYRNSPFWPVLQRLQRVFGLDPKALIASDVERLEAGLATLGVDIEETIPVLTTLLGIPTAERYPAIDASSPSFKRRTLDVLVAMIQRKTHIQPLLVVVEDVHWIDPSSLEFVRLMLERLVAARLLVLLTARPEFKPGWTYPHFVQLNLDRLSRRDCIAMIERLTGSKPLPRLVLDQIVAKTDGVPLFVEELTKTVLQSDLLHDTGRSYELGLSEFPVTAPLEAASHASKPSGQLVGRWYRSIGDETEVRFEVINAGAAIEPALLPRLFDPLQRGPDAGSRQGANLGLGLYIARQIAAAHGGKIDVRSDAQETAFTVSLPRRAVT